MGCDLSYTGFGDMTTDFLTMTTDLLTMTTDLLTDMMGLVLPLATLRWQNMMQQSGLVC